MQRKAVKCYVSIPEIWQHLSHKCHTPGKGPHQEKQRGNVERKMIFKFPLGFFSLCSCYLKWPPSIPVKISGISVTCINRLHCTLMFAWGLIVTPAVCHSTNVVQKAHREKADKDLTHARAPSCSFVNQASLCRGLRGHIPLLLCIFISVCPPEEEAPQSSPCPHGLLHSHTAEEKGWPRCLRRQEMNITQWS